LTWPGYSLFSFTMKPTAPNYAAVILPVPLPGTFTYAIPDHLLDRAVVGMRVIVQFGKRRLLSGIIRNISDNPGNYPNPKPIIELADDQPILTTTHLRFWDWIAAYYLCTPGEVLIAALPSLLRLESETSIAMHPAWDRNAEALSDAEYLVLEALRYADKLPVSKISDITGLKNVFNLLKGLIEKEVVMTNETIADSYRPKKAKMVRLHDDFQSEKPLQELFAALEKRAFKQLSILMYYIQHQSPDAVNNSMRKQELVEASGSSPAAMNALIEKGVFVESEEEVSRLGLNDQSKEPKALVLSEMQESALTMIRVGLAEQKPVLLHGVTGSGKTEIYIRLIAEAIQQGEQVLYLLPEIALTSQIIERLSGYFGNQVQVSHSRSSDQQRAELYNRLAGFSGKPEDPFVLVGARSALFLPLKKTGLIIVDEEHDHSFKQFDPAPRYQARDAALMLARLSDARIILGSATPAIESSYNADLGKYYLVQLNQRYGEGRMPEVVVADVAEATRRREMQSHYTPQLISKIKNALAQKLQVILFQNRRGFSLRLYCQDCGWHPGCPHCDVTLTYHKFLDRLKCHYCGHMTNVPPSCHECGSKAIRTSGFGTEKIEEEIAILFPGARVTRMDLDTTRARNAYQKIIHEFSNRQTDILIGTQMVSKGLDFSHVAVVGVMNADSMIALPDFRAFERSFQHIVQVSGRAGRQSQSGVVVVQTSRPSHDVIRLAASGNYSRMFEMQIAERRQFNYPPFSRLVRVVCKSRNTSLLSLASANIARQLRASIADPVLGPEYPVVSKIKDEFIRHILIKLVPDQNLGKKKMLIQQCIQAFQQNEEFRKVKFLVDVDPY
jgi:primosomal protein N' (replication factor Y) (superfamily II helicase)